MIDMKKGLQRRFILLAISSALLTGCGAMIGGSNYNAHVAVDNNPKAQIYYRGELMGTGSADLSLKRREANNVSFTVKDENGKEQQFEYKSRKFRAWPLAGILVSWISPVVDLAAGTLWKPDEEERGIVKVDYKNYEYHLGSPGVITAPENKDNQITTVDYIYTRDGSIYKGQIIEEQAKAFIKIRLKNSVIKTINFDEIEDVKRGQAQ